METILEMVTGMQPMKVSIVFIFAGTRTRKYSALQKIPGRSRRERKKFGMYVESHGL